MKLIDGSLLKNMIVSASNNLYNHYPEVDALNVFPVPDGDTGMNMNLTLTSGSKEVQNRDDKDVGVIAKTFSRGLLMGARGNSGVITSQIFRGFAAALDGKSTIDAAGLSAALLEGSKVAYKAVVKPVEGTILTVIRETSEKLANKVTNDMSIEDAFKIILKESKESLKRTPNLLPVLKEVGVVDSGGAGLVKIFEGMESALKGAVIERYESTAVDNKGAQVETDESKELAYCVEFVLHLGPSDTKKPLNLTRFEAVIKAHGTETMIKANEETVKVRVNTLFPGNLLNYAQQFGEFRKVKVDNVQEGISESIFTKEEFEADNNEKQTAANKPETEFALIATSSGKGIDKLFNEVGVDYIVSGGQTMNPSTEDFIKLIEESNAKVCYIFPNNGNIILAANQAKEVMKGKRSVEVIPTKTIMQGVVSAMNFNPELSKEDNVEVMTEAISSVKSGGVTFAIKDTEINGVNVKKDEFMAIKESKDILSCSKDKFEALKSLLKTLVDEDSAIITIIFGADVKEEEINKFNEEYLAKEYSDLDIDIREGGQPVYSFLVGIE